MAISSGKGPPKGIIEITETDLGFDFYVDTPEGSIVEALAEWMIQKAREEWSEPGPEDLH